MVMATGNGASRSIGVAARVYLFYRLFHIKLNVVTFRYGLRISKSPTRLQAPITHSQPSSLCATDFHFSATEYRRTVTTYINGFV